MVLRLPETLTARAQLDRAMDDWESIASDASDDADPTSLYVVLGFRTLQLLAGILYAAHLHDVHVKPQLVAARDMLPAILQRIYDVSIPDISKMMQEVRLERAGVPLPSSTPGTRRTFPPTPPSSSTRHTSEIMSARAELRRGMPAYSDTSDAFGLSQPWASLANHTQRLAALYKRVTDILLRGLAQLEGMRDVRMHAAPIIQTLLSQPRA